MKVVINRCYGDFNLSNKAGEYLNRKYNMEFMPFDDDRCLIVEDLPRNDPRLIDCVETLGESANGFLAKLKIVEVPDDVEWVVKSYDGMEVVEEVHRSWY